MAKRRVVITGLGTVNPLALSAAEFWDGMLAGQSGIARITKFDPQAFDSQIGGEVTGFTGPPESHVDKREAKRMDAFAQYALAAAVEAVGDSGLDFQREDLERCGVVIGSGIGGLGTLESQHLRLLEKGPSKVSALTVPKLMINAGSAACSILWGLRGHNSAVATACATAGHAITDALRAIQRGEANAMITGGSEAALTEIGLASFCALKGLSTRNDEPQRASRPWDKDRDGFIIADGAGVIVLEELEHARARGAEVYCELLGSGTSADAHHITAPDPDGQGAALAMERGLRDAAVAADEIDHINAHGTSTVLGDIGETRAIKRVFGAHAADGLPIGSTKSYVGHSLGASGGIEIVALAMTIKHQTVPATLNLEEPDPQCDLDYVPGAAREVEVRTAISNSFGFGGHNCTLVVRRFAG